MMIKLLAAATAAAAALMPATAHAFCGFYVAGSDQPLFNDATQVVLMRSGTRTVLSMQNNYKGPPEAFAMVIPVPVVLHEGDVKTLPKDVFAHIEQMGAPRLVEYWEQDPCMPPAPPMDVFATGAAGPPPAPMAAPAPTHGVKIEAKFEVGEYQIVILSAKDSTGLETWLHEQKYNIPAGAEPLLRPYVDSGSKFFVAKVDPAKVVFGPDQRAALSPLRFYYDADEFSLPIRLGLANSSGTQDLIVNILAPNQRYQVANYPNVTVPTNLDVAPSVKDHFGAFYASLFDAVAQRNPHAVVTEYAWPVSWCDPCPGPTMAPGDLQTLGADVLGGEPGKAHLYDGVEDFVLTRLHARYGKDLANDLVFKQASPIVGGREYPLPGGGLDHGARPDSQNNFQARYAIRHPWTGPIACAAPRRGIWGGPPSEQIAAGQGQPQAATNLAFAPRNAVQLAVAVPAGIPELGIAAGGASASAGSDASGGSGAAGSAAPGAVVIVSKKDLTVDSAPPAKKKSGCGCAADDPGSLAGGAALAFAALVVGRSRRRAARSK